jgi:hypothetical protein
MGEIAIPVNGNTHQLILGRTVDREPSHHQVSFSNPCFRNTRKSRIFNSARTAVRLGLKATNPLILKLFI